MYHFVGFELVENRFIRFNTKPNLWYALQRYIQQKNNAHLNSSPTDCDGVQ